MMAVELNEQVEIVAHSALDEQGGEPDAPRDYEAEARLQGWKPADEFKGDPEHHKSAEEFVNGAERNLALANARVRHLSKAAIAKDRKLARFEKDFEQVRTMMTGMEKRAYDRALADLKTQQRAAVESGDIAAFEAVADQMDELRKDAAPEPAKPTTKYEPKIVQRAYADFVAENEWFDDGATGGAKKAMTMYAGTVADELGALDEYDGTPEEYFKELTDGVKEKFGARYPKMFGEAEEEEPEEAPKPRKKLSVEGVSAITRRTGQKTAASLTEAERAQAKRFVDMGVFPNMDTAIKEYIANA